MKEIILEASMDSFDEAMAFVESNFEALEASMKAVMHFNLAADEIFTNVVSYAYQEMDPTADPLFGKVKMTIDVQETEEGPMGCLSFIDAGRPYDPLAKEDPDVTLSAEERKIGGLGIFMAKKIMNEMKYEYVDGRNVLSMLRKL